MEEKSYTVDPHTVRFDPKVAQFNVPKGKEEYSALKASIEKYGQDTPILIRNNLCGDGVHRCQIAKELGIPVLAIDVDPNMSDKEFIAKCNKDTFTGRNFSTTQKAIQGYKLVESFGYTDAEALLNVGLKKNSKSIGYARTVATSQYGKANNVLEELLKGNEVVINGKKTKSIDTARRLIKKMEEEAVLAIDNSEDIHILPVDYNDYLKTETARDWFWNNVGKVESLDMGTKIEICTLLNLKYKVSNSIPTRKITKESLEEKRRVRTI